MNKASGIFLCEFNEVIGWREIILEYFVSMFWLCQIFSCLAHSLNTIDRAAEAAAIDIVEVLL